MILTLSPTVLKISGTVGGVEFHSPRGRVYPRNRLRGIPTYVKMKTTRIRLPGPDALANMQFFNQIAAFWMRNVTSAIVQEWNTYCVNHPRFGQCGNLIAQTAYNKFLQVNMTNLRAGRSLQLYPPFP